MVFLQIHASCASAKALEKPTAFLARGRVHIFASAPPHASMALRRSMLTFAYAQIIAQNIRKRNPK
jgi:hypothetical protein